MYFLVFFVFINYFIALPQHPSTRGFAAVLGFMKVRILSDSVYPESFQAIWEKILSAPGLPSSSPLPSNAPQEVDTTVVEPTTNAGGEELLSSEVHLYC